MERQLHPLVQRYISTDQRLELILENMPVPREPVVQALFYLQQCLNRKRLARHAIPAADAAPIEGVDPELLVLMLSSWAELSCRINRPADARTLIHRAQALVSEETLPEIRAAARFTESVYADATGNKAHCESLLREAAAMVPPDSARGKHHAWDLLVFLAQQGRLAEADADVESLAGQCTSAFPEERVDVVRFINAVETCQTHEAAGLLSRIDTTPERIGRLPRALLRSYVPLVPLLTAGGAAADAHTTEEASLPERTRIVRHLLDRRPLQALRHARLDADRRGMLLQTGFDSFNMIRAELSVGNAGAARRLIELRHARGNRHYLDALFFARVELLAGNRAVAARHLAAALEDADRYRARRRIDFELRLSCEVSPLDLIELTSPPPAAQGPAVRPAGADAEGSPPAPAPAVDQGRPAPRIIGRSVQMDEVRRLIARFADMDATVLITGETGTGKELVANALHEAGPRRHNSFIPVNCGSIAETLLESELFGHERGAFTGAEKANPGLFQEAGEGTILLDEIGEISPRLQVALLRVLETGEIRAVGSTRTRRIRCRVVAATNADLDALAQQDRFRKDLLFRLQRLVIHIPPLRERPEDIIRLFRHFLDIDRRVGIHAAVSHELMEAVRAYEWPGNVRELRNVVERMRLTHSDKLSYGLKDLGLKFQNVPVTPPRPKAPTTRTPAPEGPPPDGAPPVTRAATERIEKLDLARIDNVMRRGRSQLRRRERLREFFLKYRKMTRSEVIDILGVSPNTATKDLQALVKEGCVERVTPSESTRSHYFVLSRRAPTKRLPRLAAR